MANTPPCRGYVSGMLPPPPPIPQSGARYHPGVPSCPSTAAPPPRFHPPRSSTHCPGETVRACLPWCQQPVWPPSPTGKPFHRALSSFPPLTSSYSLSSSRRFLCHTSNEVETSSTSYDVSFEFNTPFLFALQKASVPSTSFGSYALYLIFLF